MATQPQAGDYGEYSYAVQSDSGLSLPPEGYLVVITCEEGGRGVGGGGCGHCGEGGRGPDEGGCGGKQEVCHPG